MQYVFNEPQIATLKFAVWQVVGECGNTGNNAFQLAMLAIMLRNNLSENVDRITSA